MEDSEKRRLLEEHWEQHANAATAADSERFEAAPERAPFAQRFDIPEPNATEGER
jgi:hypothetical protein